MSEAAEFQTEVRRRRERQQRINARRSTEQIQCPACKSYNTFAVDKRLRYCRDCKKSFIRRLKEQQ